MAVEAARSTWGPPGVSVESWGGPARLFGAHGAPEALSEGAASWLPAALAALRVTARGARRLGSQTVSVGHWLVPCGPAAALSGGRVVLYAHGSDVTLLERLPGGRLLAAALDAAADRLVFVSRDLRDRFAALRGGRIRTETSVLPMGLPEPAPDFGALPALPKRGLRIATVGRLVPVKGLDSLAKSLAGLPGIVWLAAGDGPERGPLERLCAENGVAFHPLGPLAPPARDALLRSVDLFVQPSRREGTPLALLEAQLAGLPCVATDVGGVRDATCREGVTLVPPGDPAALRAALDAHATEPALRARAGAANAAFARRFLWSELLPAHEAALLG